MDTTAPAGCRFLDTLTGGMPVEKELSEAATKLQAAVEGLGLTYSALFVPFSQSRNAKKATKPGDYSLNWKVTISKGNRSLTTDYMQGIGHLPGYRQNTRWTNDEWEALKYACENGKVTRLAYRGTWQAERGASAIPAPELRDVMYSLSLDAGAIDAGSFEEWAGDFGYETDSRKAEQIYQACMKIALELRAMIGEAGINALREAAQDY